MSLNVWLGLLYSRASLDSGNVSQTSFHRINSPSPEDSATQNRIWSRTTQQRWRGSRHMRHARKSRSQEIAAPHAVSVSMRFHRVFPLRNERKYDLLLSVLFLCVCVRFTRDNFHKRWHKIATERRARDEHLPMRQSKFSHENGFRYFPRRRKTLWPKLNFESFQINLNALFGLFENASASDRTRLWINHGHTKGSPAMPAVQTNAANICVFWVEIRRYNESIVAGRWWNLCALWWWRCNCYREIKLKLPRERESLCCELPGWSH